MTHDINTPAPLQKPSIAKLTQALNNAQAHGAHNPAMLNEQAELLDRLFTAIIEDKVTPAFSGERYNGDTVKEWLAFALRIQKQSNDTVKSRAAIDYMMSLGAHHPIKITKQTE